MIGGPCSACGGTGIWGGQKEVCAVCHSRPADTLVCLPCAEAITYRTEKKRNCSCSRTVFDENCIVHGHGEKSEVYARGFSAGQDDVRRAMEGKPALAVAITEQLAKQLAALEHERDEIQGNAEADSERLKHRLAVLEQKLERVRAIAIRPFKGAINSSELLRALDLEPKPRVDQAMPENAP